MQRILVGMLIVLNIPFARAQVWKDWVDNKCPIPEVAAQLFPQYNFGGTPLTLKMSTVCSPDTVEIWSERASLPAWNPHNDGEIASIKVTPGCSVRVFNTENFASKKYRNSATGKEDYQLISPYEFTSDVPHIRVINTQVYGVGRPRDVFFGGKSVLIKCNATH